MNRFNIAGLSALVAASTLWASPVFNNNNLFPETRVCFRPKQVLNKENEGLLRCDNNERVGIILTPIFNELDKRDIEFSNKVASDSITQHFDSNLEQTKNFQLFSMLFGVAALGCFTKSESDRKEKRNGVYHKRRKQFVSNEMFTDSYLYPSNPKNIAIKEVANKKNLELLFSEQDKTISGNELETAKNLRALQKLEGNKQNASGISNNDSLKENLDSLLESIKSHEDGWLWDVIDSVKPIFLIGEQGSAKTSFAVGVALIREALGHRVQKIADRHLNGENSDKWNLLKSEQKFDNESSILEMLQELIPERVENIASKPKDYHQVLLDEFTQLAQIEPKKDSKAIVQRFVTSTYSDCRKAHELFIGITHSFTNATFGEGVYELRKKGWLIEKFANKKGTAPLPRICIRYGMKDNDGNILEDVNQTLPDWFRPEIISKHIKGEKLIDF